MKPLSFRSVGVNPADVHFDDRTDDLNFPLALTAGVDLFAKIGPVQDSKQKPALTLTDQ